MSECDFYKMTSPCDDCPFRRKGGVRLLQPRIREIARSLERAEFPCHKTTVESDVEDDDGSCSMVNGPNARHCAGALILLENLERPSQMMRIAERIGMYDASKLDMDADVFDSFDEMLAVNRKEQTRKARAR